MNIRCSRCGQGKIAPTSSGVCKFCLAKSWLNQPMVSKIEKLGIKELLDN